MPEIFGALPNGGAVSDLEIARQNQPTMKPISSGSMSEAEMSAYLARQNQPTVRPTGTPGSTSEAEFEAYRNAIQGRSSAVDGPTERYLDYIRMFQQFDPKAFSQSDVRRNRPMSNELTPTGVAPSPVQAPMVTPSGVSSPMNVVPGASDVQSLDDFMRNINRKAQSDSTPYLGRT